MLTSARGRAIWRVDDEDRVPGEELIGRQPAFSRLDGDRKSHLLEAAERERRIRLESGVTAPGGINGVTERHALFVCDKDDKRCHAPEISRKALAPTGLISRYRQMAAGNFVQGAGHAQI